MIGAIITTYGRLKTMINNIEDKLYKALNIISEEQKTEFYRIMLNDGNRKMAFEYLLECLYEIGTMEVENNENK